MRLTLTAIARYTGAAPLADERVVSDWSIDTRTLLQGALYIALCGEIHDGHSFLAAAAEKGAVAAIVDRRGWKADIPLLVVDDTLTALQDLARAARAHLRFPITGITGSAGKTSTKEAVGALLAANLRVTKNEGNLNNHIGVPLSLLRMDETAQAGVLELGMNHAGEIRALARIAKPSIGIVTNVGTAHIENFGSIDGIALAKRELIEELPSDGVAVLNADDARVARFRHHHRGKTLTFGIDEPAGIQALDLELRENGSKFRVENTTFEIALPGKHAVRNVLAGIGAGLVHGLRLDAMAEAARGLQPSKMRGERMVHNGVTLLNDCYNSNAEAAKAMIETLLLQPGARKIAVLGEMLEMGEWAERLHREVGLAAARADIVIGIRGAAEHLADAAREAGAEALFFQDPVDAGEALRGIARAGDVVLFKGSRGTRVERALERFMAS
ncbi:MAG: UDP-N-acetylmuramoyl-tripeptide--D-alanyl-D-alanine ligase [Acidobacteria bacterium]|nr:UDP-N-acetylmuramoyl-tripeptide--D-alanyl-D-alanine ligase [Acidobacteriota bacterium]